MPEDNQPLVPRLAVLGVFVVALLILAAAFGQQKSTPYALTEPAASYTPLVTNAEILQNWLPIDAYKTTITRIDNFLKANSILATTMAIKGTVSNDNGVYSFTLVTQPQGQTHDVTVTVQNYSGIISAAITIDGQATQDQSVPTATQNPVTNQPTQFKGFNDLINQGISTDQANNLQTAFLKFAPKAGSITVDASNGRHTIDQNTGTSTYTFAVTIDSKHYNASMNTSGISSIELFLNDPQSNQPVFDSKLIQ